MLHKAHGAHQRFIQGSTDLLSYSIYIVLIVRHGEGRTALRSIVMRTSSLAAMDKHEVETTEHCGSGHHPSQDRQAQGQHRANLPGEAWREHRGEEPHGQPGPAAGHRPRRRELEAAGGVEEGEQVEVGEADEGERATVVADAADGEHEVAGEDDEDHHGGPGEAAGAVGRRLAVGGIRARHRAGAGGGDWPTGE